MTSVVPSVGPKRKRGFSPWLMTCLLLRLALLGLLLGTLVCRRLRLRMFVVDRILFVRTIQLDHDLLRRLFDLVVFAIGLEASGHYLDPQPPVPDAVDRRLAFAVRLKLEIALLLFAAFAHRV